VLGKDLHEFSLETVTMFHSDALAAGFKLDSALRGLPVGDQFAIQD
jgi:hypothetical protein